MMVNISKTACVFLMELVYNSFFFFLLNMINSTSGKFTEADYQKVNFKAISL